VRKFNPNFIYRDNQEFMHRSRDHANQKLLDVPTSDNLRIAHICSWRSYIFLGSLLFTIFYCLVPAWLNLQLLAIQSSNIRPIAETLFVRRIQWIQLTGVCLGLICIALSIRNYFVTRSIKRSISIRNESNTNVFRRLLAKLMD